MSKSDKKVGLSKEDKLFQLAKITYVDFKLIEPERTLLYQRAANRRRIPRAIPELCELSRYCLQMVGNRPARSRFSRSSEQRSRGRSTSPAW
jgi:hypothetical protein